MNSYFSFVGKLFSRASHSTNPVEKVIFLHIPKTGGTTLRAAFYDNYSYLPNSQILTIPTYKQTQSVLSECGNRINDARLVVGHCGFGIHKHLPPGFKYVTFLRDPVERVISSFNFSKMSKADEHHKYLNKSSVSPLDFLSSAQTQWLQNAQVKLIAGVEDLMAPCTKETLDLALENIERHFLFVGLLENFPADFVRLAGILNWKHSQYHTRNVTPEKAKALVNETAKQKLLALNAFDFELYRHVAGFH